MRKKRLFALLVICVLFNSVQGQSPRLDSLLKSNDKHSHEDSLKVMLLLDISREYRKLKMPRERIQYVEKAISLGEKIKVISPLALAYNIMGLRYEGMAEYEKSIANYTRAIEIAEKYGDIFSAAQYSLNYGTVYDYLGDYNRSLALYAKAANIFMVLGQKGNLGNCYVNMGNLYKNFTNQADKSMEYLGKALEIFSTIDQEGDKRGMAEVYFSMAGVYMNADKGDLQKLKTSGDKKYAIANEYLQKARDIADGGNDVNLKGMASFHTGELEEKIGNYDAALASYTQSLQLHKEDNDLYAQTTLQLSIGRVQGLKNNLRASLANLNHALYQAKELKALEIQRDAYLEISRNLEKQQIFDSAYANFKQYIEMRDSVSNTEKQKEFARKQLQFEFDVKEREYQMGQQLADIRLKQQQGLAIRQEQQLALVNREKEIQQLNYLKKQSEMESERRMKNAQLHQNDLARRLEEKTSTQMINEQIQQVKFNRNLAIVMGTMLLFLSCMVIYIYRINVKTRNLNRLVSAQKENLEEMSRVKDKIFSIVSHDMRAPVNNLVAFGSLLDEGDIDQEKLAQYISQIKGTLNNTSSLMENLLNWAASQMQGFTPVKEKVNLYDLVFGVVKGMEPELVKKKLSLEVNIPESLSFITDRNMMELIVRNLLSNAIKFSRKGGSLEISGIQTKSSFQFSMKDSGIGIPAPKARLINTSKVITMGSSFGTEREKGTGLGLMLCKQFAILMDGSLSVESEEGKGTVFTLSLPVVVSDVA